MDRIINAWNCLDAELQVWILVPLWLAFWITMLWGIGHMKHFRFWKFCITKPCDFIGKKAYDIGGDKIGGFFNRLDNKFPKITTMSGWIITFAVGMFVLWAVVMFLISVYSSVVCYINA